LLSSNSRARNLNDLSYLVHLDCTVFVLERQALGLTEDQVKELDAMHIAVRDEPHS